MHLTPDTSATRWLGIFFFAWTPAPDLVAFISAARSSS